MAEAGLEVGGVCGAHLVEELGIVDKGLHSGGEPLRSVESKPVLWRELDRRMPEVGRRILTNVHDHAECGSPNTPNELGLRMGRRLEVEPATRPAVTVVGDVCLGDDRVETMLRELISTERACEEAAVVGARLQLHDGRPGEFELPKAHQAFSAGRSVVLPAAA